MELHIVLFLGLAGFAAGAVNAVAGGGSLLSFPALLAAGYPPVVANVTNGVAAFPGYVGGTIGYRRELEGQSSTLRVLGVVSAGGAVLGSALMLLSPADLFQSLVPWLVIFSAAILALQPSLTKILHSAQTPNEHSGLPKLLIVSHFLVSAYGGYFAAGLGVLMLASLAIFIQSDIQRLNALKGALSLVVGAFSALYFAIFGPVMWPAALWLSVTGAAGGFLGVKIARRIPSQILRWAVVVIGLVVGLVLLWRA